MPPSYPSALVRRCLTAAATAAVVAGTLTAATGPAQATGFNPLTYRWSSVGSRTVAGTDRGAIVLRRNGQILASVNTLRTRQTVRVDGAAEAGVTDSRLGASFGVSTSNLATTRGILRHSTVNTNSNPGMHAVYGASLVVEYCDITGAEDGIDPTGEASRPSLIQYNKIHRDGTTVGDAHSDGIQFWQRGHATITRNWISGWSTSAILIKSDIGPISHISIRENYLANPTGWYVLYVLDGGKGRPTYVDITGNKFGSTGRGGRGKAYPVMTGENGAAETKFVRTAAQRQTAVAAGNKSAAAWVVWSGNTWADGPHAGQEIVPPGGWLR
ncbi:MAG: hypothetical protein QOG49_1699 [Frankiaceae bacterium]|jgi:hypothetical protein|nr:hypothetical protein [Frankiaceae bacterium]